MSGERQHRIQAIPMVSSHTGWVPTVATNPARSDIKSAECLIRERIRRSD
jgi:hypothetical protein